MNVLDPVTQHHVRQAADALTDEFAGIFSRKRSSATSLSRSIFSATRGSTFSSRCLPIASRASG